MHMFSTYCTTEAETIYITVVICERILWGPKVPSSYPGRRSCVCDAEEQNEQCWLPGGGFGGCGITESLKVCITDRRLCLHISGLPFPPHSRKLKGRPPKYSLIKGPRCGGVQAKGAPNAITWPRSARPAHAQFLKPTVNVTCQNWTRDKHSLGQHKAICT